MIATNLKGKGLNILRKNKFVLALLIWENLLRFINLKNLKIKSKVFMKIIVDENLCIGCGTCESLCGECFKLEGNVAKAVKNECANCDLSGVASSCPVGAITIEK